MPDKMINRVVALGVFLTSLIVYLMTLSVTVVFWDVGEFIAAARLLQVPHPPGSPLFILIGRLVSMIPFYADIAARVHAISAVAGALGIMFLYLISVKVITLFRGVPQTVLDKFIVYGASVIGSFALAFSTTYWDNAIEAEVYGLSMLFVALIIWLALRWWEGANEPHNEKYMLLIAYLIGLSVGIHLLAVLAIFSVLMIVYFRRYEINRENSIRFGVIAVVTFFVVYPGVVQFLPSMLDGEFKGTRSDFFKAMPILFILGAGYLAYRTTRTGQKMLHIACLSFLLIVLGYTTYTMVIMRSNVDNLPMNENAPDDIARLTSYLAREQYGDTPLLKGESWDNELQGYREKFFPRRYSREEMHRATRENYSSDMDFLWQYQIYHMFIRYVLWNFVGNEGDWQDSGVSANQTLAIPLLIALLGIYYHFKKDLKMAMTFMVLFVVMGIVLDLYQNQQNPQPRERDYFYVGAYFVLALWLAVGVVALVDILRQKITQEGTFRIAASGVLAACAVAVPVNLLRINWYDHDRSQNYIAWDYSYNLLQSCEKDAILFTNGDNDTFPLWYLQDVEGVRRDVRIANLSLINTPWYIKQLKNQSPHGAEKVSITLSDQQIERIQPRAWKPRQIELPVSKDVVDRYIMADAPAQTKVSLADSTMLRDGKISFTMNGVPYSQDIRIARVQDLMVLDIVMANKWERPIYFAVTVSPDSKIGLDNYCWMHGLAWKLKPLKIPSQESGINVDIMESNVLAGEVTPTQTPQYGYLYRNLNNPKVYYNENIQRMVLNYRANFMRLAFYAMRVQNNTEKAKKIMAQMEEVIPIGVIPIQDWRFTADIMRIYNQLGDKDRFEIYAKPVEVACNDLINSNRFDISDAYNPYPYLLDIYDARKDYKKAVDILNQLVAQYPNDPTLKNRIQYYEQQMKAPAATDTSKESSASPG
ncbi:MAG TPA: DUF2723 domain-containing protein [Bacteroidota bacterium]|nr:DUF2723 domain-containing protein [Bacteroidota bacterium]